MGLLQSNLRSHGQDGPISRTHTSRNNANQTPTTQELGSLVGNEPQKGNLIGDPERTRRKTQLYSTSVGVEQTVDRVGAIVNTIKQQKKKQRL